MWTERQGLEKLRAQHFSIHVQCLFHSASAVSSRAMERLTEAKEVELSDEQVLLAVQGTGEAFKKLWDEQGANDASSLCGEDYLISTLTDLFLQQLERSLQPIPAADVHVDSLHKVMVGLFAKHGDRNASPFRAAALAVDLKTLLQTLGCRVA